MNPEAALPARRLEPGACIVQAQPWHSTPVNLDSPALAVMTDLRTVKAATTGPATTLGQAEQIMIYQEHCTISARNCLLNTACRREHTGLCPD